MRMFCPVLGKIVTTIGLFAAVNASAVVYLSFHDHDGADIYGVTPYIKGQVVGNNVKLLNTSPNPPNFTIGGVYFLTGFGFTSGSVGSDSGLSVDYEANTPAQSGWGGGASSVSFSFKPNPIAMGIDPTEWASFDLTGPVGGGTWEQKGILFPNHAIGLHVQRLGLNGEFSEKFDNLKSRTREDDDGGNVPDASATLTLAGIALIALSGYRSRIAKS